MAEVRDAQGRIKYTGPDQAQREKDEVGSAVAVENQAAGGTKEKKGKTPPPKAADFGGDMAKFGAALRKWREEQNADTDTAARTRALSK